MIYEHRIYTVIPGKARKLVEYIHEWADLMDKFGVKLVAGVFYTVIGDENEVSYILSYKDLAHREQAFNSLKEDPEYKRMEEKWVASAPDGWPVEYNTRNKILKSTEYTASKK